MPLTMVDVQGNTVLAAYIRPLIHGGFFVESAAGMSLLLLGERGDGLYDDLPYFLLDLSPQGFLGRQIAKEMAARSPDFPSDPRWWNTNHIGRYLISMGSHWPQVFDALHKKKLVSRQHVFDAEVLWCFGGLINNTDMHLCNLSLAIEGNEFRLLPLYDMCYMGFAPKSGGEAPPYRFVPMEPERINMNEDTYNSTKGMAYDFRKSVAGDKRISDEFKKFLDKGNPIDLM